MSDDKKAKPKPKKVSAKTSAKNQSEAVAPVVDETDMSDVYAAQKAAEDHVREIVNGPQE